MGINFCVEESQAEFMGGVERRRGYIRIRCVWALVPLFVFFKNKPSVKLLLMPLLF